MQASDQGTRHGGKHLAVPRTLIFLTSTNPATGADEVLLLKGAATKRLWAGKFNGIGGHVEADEDVHAAAVRELREETRLKVPLPVLRGSIKGSQVFDHPDRSLRGRTVTHAFHFHFPAGELPAVRGGDDADKARWIPVSEALDMSPALFEDHLHILEYFLGRG